MRLIGFGVIALMIGFVLLIGAARVLGNAQPPPEGLAQLHLTECALPCWLGIVPGQTTFDEGVQHVKAIYPQSVVTFEYSQVAFGLRANTAFGQISLVGGDDGIIRDISLRMFTLEGVALGDVVNLLGVPSRPDGAKPLAAFYQCENALTIVSVGDVQGGWQEALGIISIRGNGPDTCTISAP
ncbi:MAG: hypothetical protein ABI700_16900 [Chloroflexota bacterium]